MFCCAMMQKKVSFPHCQILELLLNQTKGFMSFSVLNNIYCILIALLLLFPKGLFTSSRIFQLNSVNDFKNRDNIKLFDQIAVVDK
jgi:hypothetical protein